MSIIPLIILIVCFYFGYRFLQWHSQKPIIAIFEKAKLCRMEYEGAVKTFESHLNSQSYFNNTKLVAWLKKYGHLEYKELITLKRLRTDNLLINILLKFYQYREYCPSFVEEHNNNFIESESLVVKELLDRKTQKNNPEQCKAIASGEDRTLVVAGAGSGKTTTIEGKIHYLADKLKVKPEEILVMSFNKEVQQKLEEELLPHFSGLAIYTFHAFGLNIIGKVSNKRPDVAFSGKGEEITIFLNEQFNQLLQDPAYAHKVVDFFYYYLKPVELVPKFNSLDEYLQYTKTSKQELTLQKEYVRSHQEVDIANFLYRNCINYQYEAPYKYDVATKSYRQYKPDFYLPDYDIYIEHFGINRQGMVHFCKDVRQNELYSTEYKRQMEEKRNIHKQHNTKLVETYSYEFNEHSWEQLLTYKLTQNGVQFKQRDYKEIIDELKEGMFVSQLVTLCKTFLNLHKSGGYDLNSLTGQALQKNDVRGQVFLQIYTPLYNRYAIHLNQTNTIDFNDMLGMASQYVNQRAYISSFKHILIDEFQDFSYSKYKLVKSLCDQNPETQLYCVGDDWQSIYRFAGADVSLMSDFEKNFGFTKKMYLEVTFRFGQGIADLSNNFILKNPSQISKSVRPNKPIDGEPIQIIYKNDFRDIEPLLKILRKLEEAEKNNQLKSTVLVLGRYGFNKPLKFKEIQKQFSKLDVRDYLTVHRSKGQEADYVILLDVVNGTYGFPSEIIDDPLLDMVLNKVESYPYAEERRLMYVAMTRAKKKVFIFTISGQESIFVQELKRTERQKHPASNALPCNWCGGAMIIKTNGPYGPFWGCTNYPDCRNRMNIPRKG